MCLLPELLRTQPRGIGARVLSTAPRGLLVDGRMEGAVIHSPIYMMLQQGQRGWGALVAPWRETWQGGETEEPWVAKQEPSETTQGSWLWDDTGEGSGILYS